MAFRARLVSFGVAGALIGASVAACNAITGVGDYAYDRACADIVVAKAESCLTEEVDENCDGVARCSTDGLWALGFGKTSSQAAQAVVFDHDHNVIVAGVFTGEFEASGTLTSKGGQDVFVVKLDRSGKVLWQKQFGGANAQGVGGVAVDAQNNIILAGSFDGDMEVGSKTLTSEGLSDIYVMKLDPSGNPLWSKQYGGPMAQTAAAVAVSGGNILVTGSFTGALDFGEATDQLLSVGGNDVYVVELSAAGAPTFSRAFGDIDGNSQNQDGRVIVAAPDGGFYLGGTFDGKMVQTMSGALNSTGGVDIFVLAFDAANELRWAKSFGNLGQGGTQALTSMAIAPDGGVFLAGTFEDQVAFSADGMSQALQSNGNEDLFLARLYPGGAAAWALGFGTIDAEPAPSVASDGAGNVVLTGSITQGVNFGAGLKPGTDQDIFIAKFSEDGAAINTPRFIATDAQYARAIATDDLGNIALAGTFRGSVKFEAEMTPIVSKNADMTTDAFVAVFRP